VRRSSVSKERARLWPLRSQVSAWCRARRTGPLPDRDRSEGNPRRREGSTGLYETFWRETDEWLDWHATSSPNADQCIDAIVGAATRPDAPFRIPVGEGIAEELRRKGEEMIMQAAAAEAFLDSL